MLRSRRWAVLAALALAVAIFGGAFAAAAQAQEPENPPTGEVTGLRASSPEPGILLVEWDGTEPRPSDYRLVWHKVGDPVPTWQDDEHNHYTTLEFRKIRGLQEDAEYRVRVRARYLWPVHRPQWSGPFAEVTGRVSYGLPGQPTGLTFSGVTGDGATLRWEAPRTRRSRDTG